MSKNSSSDDRRKAAREKARQIAQAQAKRERTTKIVLWAGIGVVVVAVIAVIAVLIFRSAAPAETPANTADGTITMAPAGDGKFKPVAAKGAKDVPDGLTSYKKSGIPSDAPVVKVYLDFQCPACNSFEQTNGENLLKWASDKKIGLEYYPLGLLDSQSSGNKYSTRSTNAAYCMMDAGQGNRFTDMAKTFFAQQPEEQGNGKTDKEILAMMKKSGVDTNAKLSTHSDQTITKCVTGQTFKDAVKKATQNATNDGLKSTPKITINGKEVQDWSDPKAFAQEIAKA